MTRFLHPKLPGVNPTQCLHERIAKRCLSCEREFVTTSRTALRCDACRKERREGKK